MSNWWDWQCCQYCVAAVSVEARSAGARTTMLPVRVAGKAREARRPISNWCGEAAAKKKRADPKARPKASQRRAIAQTQKKGGPEGPPQSVSFSHDRNRDRLARIDQRLD
jgi:hypothetical protein